MPLVIITGYPSSGKTTIALALKKYLEEAHKKEVIHINEENLFMDKINALKGDLYLV